MTPEPKDPLKPVQKDADAVGVARFSEVHPSLGEAYERLRGGVGRNAVDGVTNGSVRFAGHQGQLLDGVPFTSGDTGPDIAEEREAVRPDAAPRRAWRSYAPVTPSEIASSASSKNPTFLTMEQDKRRPRSYAEILAAREEAPKPKLAVARKAHHSTMPKDERLLALMRELGQLDEGEADEGGAGEEGGGGGRGTRSVLSTFRAVRGGSRTESGPPPDGPRPSSLSAPAVAQGEAALPFASEAIGDAAREERASGTAIPSGEGGSRLGEDAAPPRPSREAEDSPGPRSRPRGEPPRRAASAPPLPGEDADASASPGAASSSTERDSDEPLVSGPGESPSARERASTRPDRTSPAPSRVSREVAGKAEPPPPSQGGGAETRLDPFASVPQSAAEALPSPTPSAEGVERTSGSGEDARNAARAAEGEGVARETAEAATPAVDAETRGSPAPSPALRAVAEETEPRDADSARREEANRNRNDPPRSDARFASWDEAAPEPTGTAPVPRGQSWTERTTDAAPQRELREVGGETSEDRAPNRAPVAVRTLASPSKAAGRREDDPRGGEPAATGAPARARGPKGLLGSAVSLLRRVLSPKTSEARRPAATSAGIPAEPGDTRSPNGQRPATGATADRGSAAKAFAKGSATQLPGSSVSPRAVGGEPGAPATSTPSAEAPRQAGAGIQAAEARASAEDPAVRTIESAAARASAAEAPAPSTAPDRSSDPSEGAARSERKPREVDAEPDGLPPVSVSDRTPPHSARSEAGAAGTQPPPSLSATGDASTEPARSDAQTRNGRRREHAAARPLEKAKEAFSPRTGGTRDEPSPPSATLRAVTSEPAPPLGPGPSVDGATAPSRTTPRPAVEAPLRPDEGEAEAKHDAPSASPSEAGAKPTQLAPSRSALQEVAAEPDVPSAEGAPTDGLPPKALARETDAEPSRERANDARAEPTQLPPSRATWREVDTEQDLPRAGEPQADGSSTSEANPRAAVREASAKPSRSETNDVRGEDPTQRTPSRAAVREVGAAPGLPRADGPRTDDAEPAPSSALPHAATEEPIRSDAAEARSARAASRATPRELDAEPTQLPPSNATLREVATSHDAAENRRASAANQERRIAAEAAEAASDVAREARREGKALRAVGSEPQPTDEIESAAPVQGPSPTADASMPTRPTRRLRATEGGAPSIPSAQTRGQASSTETRRAESSPEQAELDVASARAEARFRREGSSFAPSETSAEVADKPAAPKREDGPRGDARAETSWQVDHARATAEGRVRREMEARLDEQERRHKEEIQGIADRIDRWMDG